MGREYTPRPHARCLDRPQDTVHQGGRLVRGEPLGQLHGLVDDHSRGHVRHPPEFERADPQDGPLHRPQACQGPTGQMPGHDVVNRLDVLAHAEHQPAGVGIRDRFRALRPFQRGTGGQSEQIALVEDHHRFSTGLPAADAHVLRIEGSSSPASSRNAVEKRPSTKPGVAGCRCGACAWSALPRSPARPGSATPGRCTRDDLGPRLSPSPAGSRSWSGPCSPGTGGCPPARPAPRAGPGARSSRRGAGSLAPGPPR